MRNIVWLVILNLVFPSWAIAAISEPDRQTISPRNLIKNPGAENGKASVTASGGTFTVETGAANRVSGNASFSWDSSAAGQTLSFNSTVVTSGSGLNADLYYSCYVKCATGTCTHLLELTDATATTSQAIVSSTTAFQKVSVYHPGSGTMTPRLKSVAADEPVLYVDDCRFERADDSRLQQVSQATLYGYLKYASTASCTWTTTSTTFVTFSADTDCATPTVTGNASAPATKIPAIKFATLPAGEYQVVLTGRFFKASNGSGSAKITDGTTHSGYSLSFPTTAADTGTNVLVGKFSYTTPQTDIQFQPLVLSSDGNTMGLAANAPSVEDDMEISVYRFPTSPQTVSALDQIGTSWSGYHASDCLWSVTQTTYAADFPVDTSCTFTERVNRNFGTVTSANNGTPGSNLPGITFTPKRTGTVYSVCALPTFRADDSIASGALELIDGVGTVIGDKSGSVGGGSTRVILPVCGLYVAPSTAAVTLKLRGKGQSGVVDIDTNASSPTGSIDWTIYDLSSLGAVSFKGVPVSNEDLPAHHWAHVTASGASCAITSQDGTWLSSCSQTATGTYDFVVAASMFSAAPYCQVTKAVNNGQDRDGWFDRPNSTSTLVRLLTGAGSAGKSSLANDSSGEYTLTCDGKR